MRTRIDGQDGWIEVIRDGIAILAKGDADLRARLETALDSAEGDDPADVVTDELTTGGVRRTPDFAILDEVGARVLVRGAARVRLTAADGTTREVLAPARGPWSDEDLGTDSEEVVLTVGEPAVVEAPSGDPESTEPEPAEDAELPSFDFLFGDTDHHRGSSLAEAEAGRVLPEDSIDAGPVAAAGGHHVREDSMNVTLAPPMEDDESSGEAAVPAQSADPVLPVVGPAQMAAARDDSTGHEPGGGRPQFSNGHLVGSRVPDGAGSSAASPAPGLPGMPGLPTPDHAPHRRDEPDTAEEVDDTAGPMVLAVRCAGGHHNAPHAPRCRVCGQDLPAQNPEPTPRPALGLLRLSTGEVVTLDRGVLLGRAPRASEDVSDASAPHLVRVASPDNEISRNHVEVVLDGWHVLVRDLGSTNGTTVALPGSSPVRVRPGDQQTIEPGTTITLADQVSMVFEVAG